MTTFGSVLDGSNMIEKIIADYMKTNNRLIVPSFGAFVKRADGRIIFMELLKNDDGVLKNLILQSGVVSEQEVKSYVDNFVKRVAVSTEFPIEGVGVLSRGANGLYLLRSPEAKLATPNIGSTQASSNQDNIYVKPKKMDKVMLFAIIIALLSVCVMIYAMLTDPEPRMILERNQEVVDTTKVK